MRCPPGGSFPQANFHVEWFQLGSPTLTTGAGCPLRPRMGGGQCGDTGGCLTLYFCHLFQSAVGHEYQSKLSKHCSQVDSVRGFGGKFGVQVDRVDQVSEASWAAGARGGQGASLHRSEPTARCVCSGPLDSVGLQGGCPDRRAHRAPLSGCFEMIGPLRGENRDFPGRCSG